jgi:hypothetical protein
MKSGRLVDALAAANQAVQLAPEWAEAVYVRSGIHGALSNWLVDLSGTVWRDAEAVKTVFRFFPDGGATEWWPEQPADWLGQGKWTLDGGTLELSFPSADRTYRASWDGKVMRARFRNGAGSGVPFTFVPSTEPASLGWRMTLAARAEHVEAASVDLARYLQLRPDAPDRPEVVRVIALLRVEADRTRSSFSVADAGSAP